MFAVDQQKMEVIVGCCRYCKYSSDISDHSVGIWEAYECNRNLNLPVPYFNETEKEEAIDKALKGEAICPLFELSMMFCKKHKMFYVSAYRTCDKCEEEWEREQDRYESEWEKEKEDTERAMGTNK